MVPKLCLGIHVGEALLRVWATLSGTMALVIVLATSRVAPLVTLLRGVAHLLARCADFATVAQSSGETGYTAERCNRLLRGRNDDQGLKTAMIFGGRGFSRSVPDKIDRSPTLAEKMTKA